MSDAEGDAEASAALPWLVRARAHVVNAIRGALIGLALFLLGLALFVAAGALLTLLLRLAIADLGALDFLTVAGLTVVPAYFLYEVVYSLVKRGGLLRMLGGLLGQAAAIPPSLVHGEPNAVTAFRSGLIVTLFRGYLIAFMVAALLMQCVYASVISQAVFTVWPEISPFPDAPAPPSLGALLLFWLDMPFDTFLLGAPTLYGVRLSDLAPAQEASWFLVAVFAFKLALVSETVKLVLTIWSIEPDLEAGEAKMAEMRARMAEEEAQGGS